MLTPRNPKEAKQFLSLAGYSGIFAQQFVDISRLLLYLCERILPFGGQQHAKMPLILLKKYLTKGPILKYTNSEKIIQFVKRYEQIW